MDHPDDPTLLTNVDPEIKQLLGMFDVPAFVRRGQDLEYALARLHERCRRARSEKLDMVRMRLRQWTAVASGPDDWSACFQGPIALLWPLCEAELPDPWADRPAPPRRRRAVGRDLIASIIRFNHRWSRFLDDLDLAYANRLIDQYNRYYVLEKECCLGSARLAARHFRPKPRLTRERLLDDYPVLPVPELVP